MLGLSINSHSILRTVLTWINISHSDIFHEVLLSKRFYQNHQGVFSATSVDGLVLWVDPVTQWLTCTFLSCLGVHVHVTWPQHYHHWHRTSIASQQHMTAHSWSAKNKHLFTKKKVLKTHIWSGIPIDRSYKYDGYSMFTLKFLDVHLTVVYLPGLLTSCFLWSSVMKGLNVVPCCQ